MDWANFKLFGTDVVNIFCDASIKHYNGVTYGCPGSIVVCNHEIIKTDSTILVESTNNESEIYAILLATRQAIEASNNPMFKIVNIFSDSRISVCGLRDWMQSWVRKAKNDVLMSTSGEVANQQIFLQIVHLILNNLDEYHLYHIDGHCTTDRDINRAMIDFAKFNNKDINLEEARYLCNYNNYVDNYTREYLENSTPLLSSLQRQTPGFIYPILTETELSRLYSKVFDN